MYIAVTFSLVICWWPSGQAWQNLWRLCQGFGRNHRYTEECRWWSSEEHPGGWKIPDNEEQSHREVKAR